MGNTIRAHLAEFGIPLVHDLPGVGQNLRDHPMIFVSYSVQPDYPQDPFADRIRRLLASKLLALAWHGAVAANSPPAYKAFYSQYSDSPYASLAMRLESQPKLMPLYQPTKIMVAPQLAPRIRLSNFNGVNVPQGDSAPIGLGGGQASHGTREPAAASERAPQSAWDGL